MGQMLDRIGKAAMLEQTAEEAAELAKAALKYARVIRGENPTPVTMEEAERNLFEEYTDVVTCGRELDLVPDEDMILRKQERFRDRWNQEHG